MSDMSGFKQFPASQAGPLFSFVLLPRFSLLALAGAIEPLRHANNVLGRTYYNWPIFSEDGLSVQSSSGVPLVPTGSLRNVPLESNVILVGGADIMSCSSPDMLSWLRRVATRVPLVGGLCTATRVLAEAGLLDGRRATIHWEMADSMKEAFPSVEITDRLFELDEKRMTCVGETASADMMLNLIESLHGKGVATSVAAQVLHGRVRSPAEPQAPLALRTGTRNKYLLHAISLMESHLDELIDIEGIAQIVDCSRRHLERLFKSKTGQAPITYYRNLRLDRARHLLYETQLNQVEVAVACGFQSSAAFSAAYKRRFGLSPANEERVRHKPDRVRRGALTGNFALAV